MKTFCWKAAFAVLSFIVLTKKNSAQTYERDGLQFTAAIRYSYSEIKSVAGDYPAITVHAFNSTLQSSAGIKYKGKTYYPSDFGGQLDSYFNAVKVVAMSIRFEIVNTACDHTTSIDGTWKMGETKGNALCIVSKGKRPSVLNVIVKGPVQLEGVAALRSKIDELVKKEAEEKKTTAVDKLLQDADKYLQAKQYQQAISTYDEALQTDPANSNAANGKKKAIEEQNAAALEKKKKETISKLYTQANTLLANGQYAQAIARYNQILQLDPNENTAITGKRNAEIELKKKTTQPKKEETQQQNNQTTNNIKQQESKAKADSAVAAHRKYLNEKWKQDSIIMQAQWKQKQKDKQQRLSLYGELTNQYEQNLNSSFDRADQQFASLSPEEQRKRCEQAEGYASNAALMIEMQDYRNGSKLYQQAALLCPANPKAFLWMDYAVVDFNSSLHKNEWDADKQQQLATQKQNLQLLEMTTNYSSSQVNNLYNKYQIEQGYRQLYNQAKQEADRYFNLYSKMGTVNIKFTDPASLNTFINSRIKAIENNFNKAMNAAGTKAGAEFNQTYAQTGSTKTATTTAAITGGADVLANAIVAEGAKKQLLREKEQQLREIGAEFVSKLYNNCNASLQRMLISKTVAEDSKAFSDFIYNCRRLQYACSNFSYTGTNWYYSTNFSTNQGSAEINKINYLNKADAYLSAAQRKIFFFDQLSNYRPPSCNTLDLYANGWEFNSTRFLAEARAYLSSALKINAANADAYYLLASIEPNIPRHYSYAFTAAEYARNSGKAHFAGYAAKKQQALKPYLFQLVESNQKENLNNWNSVIYYRLYNQLSSADLSSLITKLITEERTDFLNALLRSDKAYTDKAVLQAMVMDAIRLNKGNTTSVLKTDIPATTVITVNNTQLNLLQLCILENKALAFAGFCGTSTNYPAVAAEMKKFEGNYPPDHLYNCFVAAALRYNQTNPLAYIKSQNPDYFSANPDITDRAVAMQGRKEVLSWLSENNFISNNKLSEQLLNASLYNDLSTLLQLGADAGVISVSSGAGVLQHQLQRLLDEVSDTLNSNKKNSADYLVWRAKLSQNWNRYVQLLLANNAPVSIVANNNTTVFHVAAGMGDVQLMKRLLQAFETQNSKTKETLLNVQNADGETALHLAVKNNYAAMAALLIRAGAGTAVRNKEGVTPVQLAKKNNLDLVSLNNLNKQDWLNVALEEDLLAAYRLNKRGPVEQILNIVPVRELNQKNYNDYLAFQQKTFNSVKDLQTSGYLRSAEFTNAVKYLLRGAVLLNSTAGTTVWVVDHEEEIKALTLTTAEQQSNTELKLSFMVSMEGVADTKTTLDADLSLRLYYDSGSKKIRITVSTNNLINVTNVQVRKKIEQGETAVFSNPRLLLNNNGKVLQTAFYSAPSSKASIRNDVLYHYFSKSYDIQTYKDLTIRSYPAFVFVENKGKETMTVTAFWK